MRDTTTNREEKEQRPQDVMYRFTRRKGHSFFHVEAGEIDGKIRFIIMEDFTRQMWSLWLLLLEKITKN